jgi:hypothetical protein
MKYTIGNPYQAIFVIIIERVILIMVSGGIKVIMMVSENHLVSTGIRVTKAIAKYVLSYSNCCAKYQ